MGTPPAAPSLRNNCPPEDPSRGFDPNSSSPNPPFSTPVTIWAVVVGAPGVPAPTGALTFMDNGATLVTVPLGRSTGQATMTAPSASLAALALGNHQITAAYSGDGNYRPSAVSALSLVTTAGDQDGLGRIHPGECFGISADRPTGHHQGLRYGAGTRNWRAGRDGGFQREQPDHGLHRRGAPERLGPMRHYLRASWHVYR